MKSSNQPQTAIAKLTRGQIVMLCSLVAQRINTLNFSHDPQAVNLQKEWREVLKKLQEM